MADKVRVAIVGLGFGAEFIPIYQAHPNAEMYAICRRNKAELDTVRRPLRHQDALHRLRRAAQRPERRRRPHQLARSPTTPRRRSPPCKAGKHVACTVPMGVDIDECRQIVELQTTDRQGLHDDGDGRLQPRIPVRQGAVRQGRAGPDPVPARQPPAGHGRLARLLARLAADVVRHALRQPVPGDLERPGQNNWPRRERRLPRLRPHPRGADHEVQQPVRDRDGDVQDQGLRRRRRGDRGPLRHRPAVPRELRRDRRRRSASSGSRSRTRSR